MEETVSREYFFQLSEANVAQIALHPIPSERERYPKECDTTIIAGMKMNATASKATAVVCAVPAEAGDSNMATSWVVGVA